MSVQTMRTRKSLAKQKATKVTRPFIHLSLFDWRVSMGIGLLFGIVIGTAPQMLGTLLLLGIIVGTIKLVDKGRL